MINVYKREDGSLLAFGFAGTWEDAAKHFGCDVLTCPAV